MLTTEKEELFHSDERLWTQTCFSCGLAVHFKLFTVASLQSCTQIQKSLKFLTTAAFWGKHISTVQWKERISSPHVSGRKHLLSSVRITLFLKLTVVTVLWRALKRAPDTLRVQPNISAMARIIIEVIVK